MIVQYGDALLFCRDNAPNGLGLICGVLSNGTRTPLLTFKKNYYQFRFKN